MPGMPAISALLTVHHQTIATTTWGPQSNLMTQFRKPSRSTAGWIRAVCSPQPGLEYTSLPIRSAFLTWGSWIMLHTLNQRSIQLGLTSLQDKDLKSQWSANFSKLMMQFSSHTANMTCDKYAMHLLGMTWLWYDHQHQQDCGIWNIQDPPSSKTIYGSTWKNEKKFTRLCSSMGSSNKLRRQTTSLHWQSVNHLWLALQVHLRQHTHSSILED